MSEITEHPFYEAANSLSRDDIVQFDMPEENVVTEGQSLIAAIEEDKDTLLEYDLEDKYIRNLPQQLKLFILVLAEFSLRFDQIETAKGEWPVKKKEGYIMRTDLYETFMFIFRKNKDILETIGDIRSGRGNEDMLFDLYKYYKLGKNNLDKIARAKLTEDDIEAINTLYRELSSMYADSKIEIETDETYILLKKAFTILDETMTEIRDVGFFAFRDNPERQKRYVSDFHRELGEKTSATWRKKAETQSNTETGEIA